jgi:hypothetical protein
MRITIDKSTSMGMEDGIEFKGNPGKKLIA